MLIARSPAGLGAKVEPGGIGTPNDQGDLMERGIDQLIAGQKRIEAAEWTFVAQLDPFHVERGCAGLFGSSPHLGRGHEEELRIGIDEPGDQPGTGHSVDLGTGPSRPLHRANSMVDPRPEAEAASQTAAAAAAS